VTFEVCVVEELERITGASDYFATAGEMDTFEFIEEGSKGCPVQEDTVVDTKEFGAKGGATGGCETLNFKWKRGVGCVEHAGVETRPLTRGADCVDDVCVGGVVWGWWLGGGESKSCGLKGGGCTKRVVSVEGEWTSCRLIRCHQHPPAGNCPKQVLRQSQI